MHKVAGLSVLVCCLQWPSEEDIGGSVLPNLTTQEARDGDRLKRKFLPA